MLDLFMKELIELIEFINLSFLLNKMFIFKEEIELYNFFLFLFSEVVERLK